MEPKVKELLHVVIKFFSFLFFLAGLSLIAIEYLKKVLGIDVTPIMMLLGGVFIGSYIARQVKMTSSEK